jgi:hypothetical protein
MKHLILSLFALVTITAAAQNPLERTYSGATTTSTERILTDNYWIRYSITATGLSHTNAYIKFEACGSRLDTSGARLKIWSQAAEEYVDSIQVVNGALVPIIFDGSPGEKIIMRYNRGSNTTGTIREISAVYKR